MDRSNRPLHAVTEPPTDPHRGVSTVEAVLAGSDWSAMLLDADWTIRWASPALRQFLGAVDEEGLGIGRNFAEAALLPAYARTTDDASRERLIREVGAYIVGDLAARGIDARELVAPELAPLLELLEPRVPPAIWGTDFTYLHPDGVEELGGYVVKVLFLRTGDRDGDLGWTVLFDIAVPPRLVSLLARGDPAMYERMARLVQPGPRAAAILFCDLSGSTTLSRRLPTAEYFRLIRQLWTAIDGAVADGCGIVGKHAGDGASAFFLADDLGDASRAARAAITTARTIHELSADIFRDIGDRDCLMKVGVHWGASLYLGQLVPGGRLDVTALGDEVNEAARIQEVAEAHQTLASKQLVERLGPDDAEAVGLRPHAITYRLLAELAAEHPKVVRDAGTLAVTPV